MPILISDAEDVLSLNLTNTNFTSSFANVDLVGIPGQILELMQPLLRQDMKGEEFSYLTSMKTKLIFLKPIKKVLKMFQICGRFQSLIKMNN